MLTAAVHFLRKGGGKVWQAMLARDSGLAIWMLSCPKLQSMSHGCKRWPALCHLKPVLCSSTLISCPVAAACSICAAQTLFKAFSAGGWQVVACSVDSVYDHLAWIHTPKEKNGLGGCCMYVYSHILL